MFWRLACSGGEGREGTAVFAFELAGELLEFAPVDLLLRELLLRLFLLLLGRSLSAACKSLNSDVYEFTCFLAEPVRALVLGRLDLVHHCLHLRLVWLSCLRRWVVGASGLEIKFIENEMVRCSGSSGI